MNDSTSVLQQAETGIGDVLSYINALEVEEVLEVELVYEMNLDGYFTAFAEVPYKDQGKTAPPQLLGYIYSPLSDVDEFVQPLPAFGTTGYDPTYDGYPGAGFVQLTALTRYATLFAVSDGFFFDGPTSFRILVLKDKAQKRLIDNSIY